MMNGSVHNGHVLLPVTLRLPGQPDFALEFVVDTGFTDFLTLPPAAVLALQLPFLYNLPINLANDSNDVVAVHQITIVWHGIERTVRVFATGKRPLLGTALLERGRMAVHFIDGGMVTVDP